MRKRGQKCDTVVTKIKVSKENNNFFEKRGDDGVLFERLLTANLRKRDKNLRELGHSRDQNQLMKKDKIW